MKMNKKRYLLIIGIVVAAAIVSVLLYTMLANHQPVISSLVSEPERVVPRGSCQVVCNATDADGDELSYGWSADGGGITGEGAAITWTAPSSAGSYNITVTVTDGRGAGVVEKKTIEVRSNRSPKISDLRADADWVLLGGSIEFTCDASDPDGDALIYEWTATGGDFSGEGTAVNWTAPGELGVYYITVAVKDGYGSMDTRTLPVSVVTGQPPIIDDLLITADHCYLKTNTSPYKVGQGKMYHIQCVVADADVDLSYNWSCTGGEISETSEDGSMITWIAPDVSGKVTITVIVSNISDREAVKALLLDVASCSSCSFPGCTG